MSSATSPASGSPRLGSTKIKYTSQHKRKVRASRKAQEGTEDESDDGNETSSTLPLPSITRVKAGSGTHTPSRTPTKAGAQQSPPGSGRSKTRDGSMKPPSKPFVRPTTPSRGSPASAGAFSPSLRQGNKPPSKGPVHKRAASDTASTTGRRSRRKPRPQKNTAERREVIHTHPLCGNLEAHRVFCTSCNAWVPLSEKTVYALRPWYAHLKACGGAGASEEQEEDGEDGDDTSSVAPSVTPSLTPSERVARTGMPENQRKALLKADPRAVEVRSHEIHCRACGRWIKLHKTLPYIRTNWEAHQARCGGAEVPSSRVEAAERKLKLVNDSRARSFTAERVECATCGEAVALEGEGEYNLAKWEEHKNGCPDAMDTSDEALTSAPVPSDPPLEPPPPTIPTDAASPADQANPPVPMKRSREEDEEEDADARPVQRTRTESYRSRSEKVSWVDWVMLPFRTFMIGFREGRSGGTAEQEA